MKKTKWKFPEGEIWLGDCLDHMKAMKEKSVDLIISSPPYCSARLYLEDGKDLGIARDVKEWIPWMVEVFRASLRVCKGLVAYVVGSGQGGRQWSGAPALLCTALLKAGVNLRSPVFYYRYGIMGGGGNDWLRGDVEWIICATDGTEKLPWSDQTACGHPPKFAAGGSVSNRTVGGTRVNAKKWQEVREQAKKNGVPVKHMAKKMGVPLQMTTGGYSKGDTALSQYVPPEKSNPGNVIFCGSVGSNIGSKIGNENEAPFPEKLPDFFIRSFCPVGGVVYDPFGGSGTTMAVAVKTQRKFLTSDLRKSQVNLMLRRLTQARTKRGFLP